MAWQRRQDLAAYPARPLRVGWALLVPAASAFPLGWFLQAQVAPKPVVLWWLALAWLAAAAGFVLVAGGRAHLRRLAFPLAFVIFALPLPARVLVPLQAVLQTATAAASAALLPLLGVPTQRSGFALYLPGGPLEVAEACSGVRSVTALTALAAFVACLKDFGPARGTALLVLSVPVIAAVNICRVVLSGLIQESVGTHYVLGVWHEALGVVMILLGLALILALARLFERPAGSGEENAKLFSPTLDPVDVAPANPRTPPAPPKTGGEKETPSFKAGEKTPRRGLALAALLALSASATGAAQFLGEGVEQTVAATARLEDLPATIGDRTGRDLPVDERVTQTLTYDAMLQRAYTDPLGYESVVSVIFWSSQNMVKGYHHPDVCLPNQGFRETPGSRGLEAVPVAGGGVVPMTVREFSVGSERRLVLYWTQEGRRVWSDEDERQAKLSGDSHRWLTDRLFSRPSASEDAGRLVVWVLAPTWGDGAAVRKETLAFAGRVADAMYGLCPWARPAPAVAAFPDNSPRP